MKLTIDLDDLDATAVHMAIATHQSQRICGEHILPDGESDTAGAVIAEICRDWLEAQGLWPGVEAKP